MRILYIDDDKEDIEIFHEAIKTVDPSIQYSSANSGIEAFAFLNQCDALPNHIVLDYNMPGMSGKVCLQELRKDRKFDGINVIIYSTNYFPKDVEDMQSMGATVVKKANSFTDLCGMIRRLTITRTETDPDQ